MNPMLALAQGDLRHEEEFDDSLEDAWRDKTLAMIARYRQALARYESATLTDTQRTSLAMLHEQLESADAYYGSPLFETARMLPIDQFQGEHTVYAADASAAGAYPYVTVTDYDKALLRADRYARWTDEAIARLREGLLHGVVLPRMVVERILPQLAAHLGKSPTSTEFWHPLQVMPADFSRAQRARLRASFRAKIATVIQPAYRRLHEFLKNEYLPHARASVGLGEIPGGAALYEYDVRLHTTTRQSPAEIHALGIAEVSRIESELVQIQQRLRIEGSLQDLFSSVRGNQALRFRSRDQIIPAFEAARHTITGRLPRLFDVMPRAEFRIAALPDSSQQMMAHSSMTRAQATAEVERYVAYPGQALSYKIGELKIRELRTRAERALGERFDLKVFHDRVLQGGSLPLTILEQNIDRWIATGGA